MPSSDLTREEFKEILEGCREIFQNNDKKISGKERKKPAEKPGKFLCQKLPVSVSIGS